MPLYTLNPNNNGPLKKKSQGGSVLIWGNVLCGVPRNNITWSRGELKSHRYAPMNLIFFFYALLGISLLKIISAQVYIFGYHIIYVNWSLGKNYLPVMV